MLLSARQCGLRPAPLPVQARSWLSCITSLRTCHTPVLPFHGEIGPAVPGRSRMASCRVETDPIGHEEHVQHLDTRSRRLARHLENHAWHLSEGNGSVQGGGVSLTMRRAFGLAWKIGAGKRGNQAQQGGATPRGPSTHPLDTPHTQRGLARPSPQDLSRSPTTLPRRAFSGPSNPANACPATLRAAQGSTREAKVAGESSPCELPTVWPVALVGFLLKTCNSCLGLLHKPSVPPVPAVPTLHYPPPYCFLLGPPVLESSPPA